MIKGRLLVMVVLATLVWHTVPQAAGAVSVGRMSIGSKKIVEFKDGVGHDEQSTVLLGVGANPEDRLESVDGQAVVLSESQIAQLSRDRRIERIHDDVELMTLREVSSPSSLVWSARPPVQLARHTASPAQTQGWNIDLIDAPEAWASSRGAGVKVGLVDTGIDRTHPDLAGNIAAGASFVAREPNFQDQAGHGSHVAGIVAAIDNSSGVVGVAPSARLYIAKALDRRGQGYLSDIIAAIEWSVDQDVDLLNMSLGTTADLPLLHEAITEAYNAGITIVAAAGNDGGPVSYPAAYEEVIGVGMVDEDGSVHRRSSRGPELDLVAPGYKVTSTYKNGKYKIMAGTSMASPHVAGALAVLLGSPTCRSGCSPSQLRQYLTDRSRDIPPTGFDTAAGYGLLNVPDLLGL